MRPIPLYPILSGPRIDEWIDPSCYDRLDRIMRNGDAAARGITIVAERSPHPSGRFQYAMLNGKKRGFFDPHADLWVDGRPSFILAPLFSDADWEDNAYGKCLHCPSGVDRAQYALQNGIPAAYSYVSQMSARAVHQELLCHVWVPVPEVRSLSYTSYHGWEYSGVDDHGRPVGGSLDRLLKHLRLEDIPVVFAKTGTPFMAEYAFACAAEERVHQELQERASVLGVSARGGAEP
jgi:hypothetical protein